MAGKAKALTSVVKLGVRYGPVAYEAIRHGQEPAREYAQKQLNRLTARKQAMTHAQGLTDGSALAVYEGDQQVWVVFNGDQPVASHPSVTTPLAELVRDYDLAKRVRPTVDQRPKAGLLGAIRRKR
jgi:hypothetical protein